MRLTWKITVWEVMRNLRNKQFIIGLLMTPLIAGVFSGGAMLLQRIDSPVENVYYVYDGIGVAAMLEASSEYYDTIRFEQTDQIADIEQFLAEQEPAGYLELTSDFIDTGKLTVHVREISGIPDMQLGPISVIATSILQQLRTERAGMDTAVLAEIMTPPDLVFETPGTGQPPDARPIGVAIALAVILMVLILSSGGMLLYSALQEKRDRMAEVVLSSVNADQLMQGKIIAHLILGIVHLAVWAALGIPIAYFVFNVKVWEVIALPILPVLLLFALMGYLLYASLFVGMGATIADIQSAGNTQGVAFMLPAMTFFFIGPVLSNPGGMIATFGTLFPLTSPGITMMRLGLGSLPTWELVTGGLILLLTTYISVRVFARLFRTGMLMYGKNASLAEMWKWIRYSD